MVIGAFPIAKLSVLLIKQISKPIANVCKERAKSNPFFRTYVCMPPAQFYNWCEVKAKMWILNLGKPVNIPVLSQEMAIELGANLLGETVIFVIGAGLLIIEYNRQSNKEAAKEAKRLAELGQMQTTITDLYFTVQQQQTQLRELERIVVSIAPNNKPSTSPPVIKEPPNRPVPPGASEPVITKFKKEDIVKTETITSTAIPYPNKGIILQSLNYIQMDVFSSAFFNNNTNTKHPNEETLKDNAPSNARRQPSVLTGVLYNIENDFRSLF